MKTRKGKVVIIPQAFSGFFGQEHPYSAITQPYMLYCLGKTEKPENANILSRCGISIRASYIPFNKNKKTGRLAENVTIDVTKFKWDSVDEFVVFAIECVRLTAIDERLGLERPVVRIVGEEGDKKKWGKWEEKFNKQELTERFKKP